MGDLDVPKAVTASREGLETLHNRGRPADVDSRPAELGSVHILDADKVKLGCATLIENLDAKPLILRSIVAGHRQISNHDTADVADQNPSPQSGMDHRSSFSERTNRDGLLGIGVRPLIENQVPIKRLAALQQHAIPGGEAGGIDFS